MMEKREFYGSSVDEAAQKAASELGVATTDLEYTVLDEGNTGFLGIGARDARIQIEAEASPSETVPVAEAEVEPSPVTAPMQDATDPTESESRGGEGTSEVFADDTENGLEEVSRELLDETEGLVAPLLDAMGFESKIDVYDAGGFVAVDVSPDNTALFIGQKGETIDALQYLINASLNKGRTLRARIVLDAEGYRQRRIEAIQGMAHRTARRALREDRTVELPPMNPAERRVVHLFLRDNPKVITDSEGSGEGRRVRITPA